MFRLSVIQCDTGVQSPLSSITLRNLGAVFKQNAKSFMYERALFAIHNRIKFHFDKVFFFLRNAPTNGEEASAQPCGGVM